MAIDYNRITPRLYVGNAPRSIDDIDILRKVCGVSGVLNLQTDADMAWINVDWPKMEKHYQVCGMEAIRVPIHDFDIAELRDKLPRCAAAVDILAQDGSIVYIHCTAGINRAPTVAIAYLYRYLGFDLDKAIHTVTKARMCDPHLEALYECQFDI